MRASGFQWVVTGAGGMLATDMVEQLQTSGASVRALSRDELDITVADAITDGIRGADVVVNCAAYTAVDAAEADEDAAHLLNAIGPGLLASACKRAGTRLIHVSTDYVFAGDGTVPYPEDARPAPQGAYGRTKAAGERAVTDAGGDHLIVRTAWLYGAAGPCFPKTIAKAGAERGHLDVVDDQIGQPTWTRDLADFVIALVAAGAPSGIYHGTSSGKASWYEFAREICVSAGLGDIVSPVPSSAYPRPAPRPAWSVLGHDASETIGVASIGDWRDRWEVAAAEVLGT
jgi:dTDP-4-dehydrorhamnose reductase